MSIYENSLKRIGEHINLEASQGKSIEESVSELADKVVLHMNPLEEKIAKMLEGKTINLKLFEFALEGLAKDGEFLNKLERDPVALEKLKEDIVAGVIQSTKWRVDPHK